MSDILIVFLFVAIIGFIEIARRISKVIDALNSINFNLRQIEEHHRNSAGSVDRLEKQLYLLSLNIGGSHLDSVTDKLDSHSETLIDKLDATSEQISEKMESIEREISEIRTIFDPIHSENIYELVEKIKIRCEKDD